MSEELQDLGALIQSKQADAVVGFEVNSLGELVMEVTPASLPSFVEFLRSNRNCKFSTLMTSRRWIFHPLQNVSKWFTTFYPCT